MRKPTVAKKTKILPRRCCGTMESHNRLLERTPGYRQILGDLETASRAKGVQTFSTPVTIPVVVHVLYRTAKENISDAQIRSQIDVLNADYQASNPDKAKVPGVWSNLLIDSKIRFALATRTPLGKKTNGIVRKKTTRSQFLADDGVKSSKTGGANPWPSNRFLNIWACSLGDGLLGYAQFPGGPAATDGVVILNTAFGNTGTAKPPFGLGRTATHEVGHWLNLRHIWGDTDDCTGSDFVADTPGQQHPNRASPVFPHVSCNNAPNGDMFMNYMDYVDDSAMVMFTRGQVARMHATLETARSSFMAAEVMPTG